MIIIRLTGGLGNQLFQYAYGRALSLDKNEELFLDTSWYKGRINRSFDLQKYNIEAKEIKFLSRILHRHEILSDTQGIWNTEKYFKKYADVINKELTLKYPLSESSKKYLENIGTSQSISIHLRGTDYVTGNKSSFHGTPSAEYYQKAVEIMRQRVPNPHFHIFTDDLPWAKGHISFPEPYTVASETIHTPHEELFLMSSCKHNIIANSTFSWWGAWLNQNRNKIIIAPSKWFADEKAHSSDILPISWMKI